nr:MAG TPA: hypothetical protein [Caudoviricetes sp.]
MKALYRNLILRKEIYGRNKSRWSESRREE